MRGWMLARARRSAFKSGLVPAGGKARNPGQGGDGRPTRDLPGPWRGSEARGASAGLGATARERRGQHPAPRASPGGSFTGISLRGVTAVPSPGRFFAASSPRRSAPGPPAWPGAPRAQPPEVRAGGPGEENPERAALYFVSGVCIGLVLTLAALVMRISCHTDCRQRPRKKFLQDRESSSDSSDSEDGSSDTASDISVRRHRRFERTLNKNVFTSAEELERAQRLEERERIIREIWMNGQPEVPGTRSLNRYY
ncbi:protein eva-1 homolog A isoform X1 [Mustela putorius furo]|uniref:Protein eva-1 homolog A isoform X1 n=2 Tax=Mustela putorius furo TaxID=9669 RepID=A0A8U0NP65_MUSPF|nr:protein eva-1 homolog A isoform X1 [Mustela putorius furo]